MPTSKTVTVPEIEAMALLMTDGTKTVERPLFIRHDLGVKTSKAGNDYTQVNWDSERIDGKGQPSGDAKISSALMTQFTRNHSLDVAGLVLPDGTVVKDVRTRVTEKGSTVHSIKVNHDGRRYIVDVTLYRAGNGSIGGIVKAAATGSTVVREAKPVPNIAASWD